MSQRALLITLLWLAAFGAGLAIDRPVAQLMHDQGWDIWLKNHRTLASILKAPGEYWFTVAVAIAAFAIFVRASRAEGIQAAALVAAAGAVSGVNGLIKWISGRKRPITYLRGEPDRVLNPLDFRPFPGGISGLFGAEKDLCFPSGHACLAFAAAAALAILLPRWRLVFFAVAAVTAVERIVENAHWTSDVIAAAALGVASAHVARLLLRRLQPTRQELSS